MKFLDALLDILKISGPVAYSYLEYRLGKTDHGSVLGLLKNVATKKSQKEVYDMNNELKQVLKALMDAGKLGQMLIKNKGLSVEEEGPALQLFQDFSPAMSGFSAGIQQLKNLDSAGEADLISFVNKELGIVDPKAADIFLKGANFLFAGYQLEQAIKK